MQITPITSNILNQMISEAKKNVPFNGKLTRIDLPQKHIVDGIEVYFTNEIQKAVLYYEMDFPPTQQISDSK